MDIYAKFQSRKEEYHAIYHNLLYCPTIDEQYFVFSVVSFHNTTCNCQSKFQQYRNEIFFSSLSRMYMIGFADVKYKLYFRQRVKKTSPFRQRLSFESKHFFFHKERFVTSRKIFHFLTNEFL